MKNKIYINKRLFSEAPKRSKWDVDEDTEAIVYDQLKDVLDKMPNQTLGIVSDIQYIDKNFWSGYWWNAKVSEWMPNIRDDFVNFKESYFKQVCQMHEIGDMDMFCRSDSGAKIWAGQVVDCGLVNIIKSKCQIDDMMFFAPIKFIENEMRFWVRGQKIIASSKYHLDKWDNEFEQENIKKMTDKVIEMMNVWSPEYIGHERYTIDMCVWRGEAKIVEYNCWYSSGFYDADVDEICRESFEVGTVEL